MIEVRSLYSDWREVTASEAREYVKAVKGGITCMGSEEVDKYINENRLRGITVEELRENG